MARKHEGHPDPPVAVVATAALVGVPFLSTPPRPSSSNELLGPLLWWLVVVSAVILSLGWTGLTPRVASRVEAANVRRLLDDDPVGAPTPLAVHPRPRRWWLAIATAAAAVAGLTLFTAFGADPLPWRARLWTSVAFVLPIAGMMLLIRAGQPPWAKRRPWRHDPLAVLDDEGVAVSYLGIRVPWHAVAGVDVEPARQEAGTSVRVTVHVHDPDAAPANATPPHGRRRQLRQTLEYGEISLPAQWCVETPEQIIRASAAYLLSPSGQPR